MCVGPSKSQKFRASEMDVRDCVETQVPAWSLKPVFDRYLTGSRNVCAVRVRRK